MKVTLMLADSAQAVEGKLYILGGGWSVTGPEPTPMAIAMKLEVPWDETNRRHAWRLELLDSDGGPVTLSSGADGRAIEIGGEFEVGRPAGVKPGTPIDLPLAINLTRPGARARRPLRLEAVDRRPHRRGLAGGVHDAAGRGQPGPTSSGA